MYPNRRDCKMSTPSNIPDVDYEAIEQLIASHAQEFLVDAVETLGNLGILVSETHRGQVDIGYTLQTIRREIHTLKGLGGSFGFPSITVIAHRLENYLVDQDTLNARQLDDVLKFIDRLQEIADSGINPEDEEVSRIVRTLPAKGAVEDNFQEASNLEILLVAGSRIVRRAVEGELNKRGFRVVTVESPIDVFETVIRTRPDMVIASAMMDKISGIDLACALKSMTATSHIPFALLTSFDASHSELRHLPEGIGLVHHDRDITAELDEAVKCLSPSTS